MGVMWVLIWHVLLLMLVIELATIGWCTTLWNQVSAPNKWPLVTASITVFTNIIHPLALSFFTSNRLNITWACLWAYSIITIVVIVILSNFGLVVLTNGILCVIVLLLLRYLEALWSIAYSFSATRSSYWPTNAIRFFRWPSWLMTFFLDDELLPVIVVFLL